MKEKIEIQEKMISLVEVVEDNHTDIAKHLIKLIRNSESKTEKNKLFKIQAVLSNVTENYLEVMDRLVVDMESLVE